MQDKFDAAGAVILGASFDTPELNALFRTGEGFSYALLCDTDKTVGTAYGVADADYPARATFVIQGGDIKKVWPKVSPAGHAAAVLEYVKTL